MLLAACTAFWFLPVVLMKEKHYAIEHTIDVFLSHRNFM